MLIRHFIRVSTTLANSFRFANLLICPKPSSDSFPPRLWRSGEALFALKPVSFRHKQIVTDSQSRCSISIADAHRDGKRFIVRTVEKLSAFLELDPRLALAASLIEEIAEPNRHVSGKVLHKN